MSFRGIGEELDVISQLVSEKPLQQEFEVSDKAVKTPDDLRLQAIFSNRCLFYPTK